jgi:hypothetical protein
VRISSTMFRTLETCEKESSGVHGVETLCRPDRVGREVNRGRPLFAVDEGVSVLQNSAPNSPRFPSRARLGSFLQCEVFVNDRVLASESDNLGAIEVTRQTSIDLARELSRRIVKFSAMWGSRRDEGQRKTHLVEELDE